MQLIADHIKRDLASAVVKGWAATDQIVREHPQLQHIVGYDVRPHIRRACIDTAIEALAVQHPEIRAFVGKNNARNCSHVRLYVGSVVLTASYVESAKSMPREAVFRGDLAQNTPDLFGSADVENMLASPDGLIYTLLRHGGANVSKTPAFIGLVVPSRDQRSCLYDESLPVVKVRPEEVEEIADRARPTLKRDAARKQDVTA